MTRIDYWIQKPDDLSKLPQGSPEFLPLTTASLEADLANPNIKKDIWKYQGKTIGADWVNQFGGAEQIKLDSSGSIVAASSIDPGYEFESAVYAHDGKIKSAEYQEAYQTEEITYGAGEKPLSENYYFFEGRQIQIKEEFGSAGNCRTMKMYWGNGDQATVGYASDGTTIDSLDLKPKGGDIFSYKLDSLGDVVAAESTSQNGLKKTLDNKQSEKFIDSFFIKQLE